MRFNFFGLILVKAIRLFMSGDNLHGVQPIKFYSESITFTKFLLIQHHLSFVSLDKIHENMDEKYNEFMKLITSQQ